jgi:predicted amidohydrolase
MSVTIALAAPRVAASIDEGLGKVSSLMADARARGARIVCLPEAYVPGPRGLDFDVPPFTRNDQARVIESVARLSRQQQMATILGMEWISDAGRHIAAAVIDTAGTFLGVQTKNQLDPDEERHYVPGRTRQLFEIGGLKFGIAICHEGFRYPETVRWAARRGAHVVFHPHCTGSDKAGPILTEWGSADSPYYERAMMCRALENSVYLAGVNYAFRHQESATCVIDPSGRCQAWLPYGQEGVLVQTIDPSAATGLLARRYAPDRYEEPTED